MNISDVKSTIAEGSEAADEARTGMIEAADQITDVRGRVGVTHDSRHWHVEVGHTRLRQAAVEAVKVAQLLSAATDATDAYREALG